MDLGERIATLREEQALTQADLAESARISPSTLSQIESGRVPRPHVGTVRKIARALGVEPQDLWRARELAAPLGEAPLPRTREECAFVVVKRVEEDENGDEWFRWVVKWGVPREDERGQYRAIIAQLVGGADYREEEMSPLAAELIAAGA